MSEKLNKYILKGMIVILAIFVLYIVYTNILYPMILLPIYLWLLGIYLWWVGVYNWWATNIMWIITVIIIGIAVFALFYKGTNLEPSYTKPSYSEPSYPNGLRNTQRTYYRDFETAYRHCRADEKVMQAKGKGYFNIKTYNENP